jgi:hypothetical protein
MVHQFLQPLALKERTRKEEKFPAKVYGEKIVKAMLNAAENVADSRKMCFYAM